MTRTNVSFYNLANGHSSLVGEGKEIKLGNGNTYAIIEGVAYLVVFDGYNNQQLIPVTVIKDCMGNDIVITLIEAAAIKAALREVQAIEDYYYPVDGSQNHVDHHIYNEQRQCVVDIEENLEERYCVSIRLI